MLAGGCASLYDRGPVAENVIHARSLTRRGQHAQQRGDHEAAARLYEQAIEACPQDGRPHRQAAELLWQMGRKEQALEHMKKLLELTQTAPHVLTQYGRMLYENGDQTAAELRCRQALQSDPELGAAWALRGDLLASAGKFDDALLAYHRALAEGVPQPRIRYQVAEIYRRQGRPHRALSTLRNMLHEQPELHDRPEIQWSLGLVYRKLERYDQACDALRLAAGASASPQVYSDLAETELRAGRHDQAQLAASRALRIAPNHATARQILQRIADRRSQDGRSRY